MHVRIIHQYFRHPGEGGALRTWYLGRYLSDNGYQVSIITGGNISGYHEESIDGMNVHYLPIYYSNHLGFLSRMHAFWLFVRKSIRLIQKLPPADVHYILTTPLTTGIIGMRLKKKLGIPYIFEVGDIWPEAPKQLGILNNKLMLYLAGKLEKASYQKAGALVGLSPEIAGYLERFKSAECVCCIPNISDTQFFQPDYTPSADPFIISYIGTLGQANHLEFLLEAAACVPADMSVKILIMGDGAQAEKLKHQAQNLKNITFLPHGNRAEVRDLLDKSNAIYVSFMDVPVLTSGSPNKFFDGLAAGKLVIINFGGWVRQLIEENRCGFYYSPRKPSGLWEKLRPFIEDKDLLSEYQQNSRQLAETRFSPDIVFEKLKKMLARFNPSGSVH